MKTGVPAGSTATFVADWAPVCFQRRESLEFARRALVDFALKDDFEARPAREQAGCLRWIGSASGEREEERRVTRMLASLDQGGPLPGSETCPLAIS